MDFAVWPEEVEELPEACPSDHIDGQGGLEVVREEAGCAFPGHEEPILVDLALAEVGGLGEHWIVKDWEPRMAEAGHEWRLAHMSAGGRREAWVLRSDLPALRVHFVSAPSVI